VVGQGDFARGNIEVVGAAEDGGRRSAVMGVAKRSSSNDIVGEIS